MPPERTGAAEERSVAWPCLSMSAQLFSTPPTHTPDQMALLSFCSPPSLPPPPLPSYSPPLLLASSPLFPLSWDPQVPCSSSTLSFSIMLGLGRNGLGGKSGPEVILSDRPTQNTARCPLNASHVSLACHWRIIGVSLAYLEKSPYT